MKNLLNLLPNIRIKIKVKVNKLLKGKPQIKYLSGKGKL
jgi:hypothetical protein